MKNEYIHELENINTIKLNNIISTAKAVHVEYSYNENNSKCFANLTEKTF